MIQYMNHYVKEGLLVGMFRALFPQRLKQLLCQASTAIYKNRPEDMGHIFLSSLQQSHVKLKTTLRINEFVLVGRTVEGLYTPSMALRFLSYFRKWRDSKLYEDWPKVQLTYSTRISTFDKIVLGFATRPNLDIIRTFITQRNPFNDNNFMEENILSTADAF